MFSRLVQDRFVPVQALTLIAPGRQNKLHIAINRAVARQLFAGMEITERSGAIMLTSLPASFGSPPAGL